MIRLMIIGSATIAQDRAPAALADTGIHAIC